MAMTPFPARCTARGFGAAWLLALCFFPAVLLAAIDPAQLPSQEMQARYRQLIEEMRCPKCQNQNLAGSDSPIAADLRREIRRLLEEGKSDEEITAFLVERYGDYIRYRPPVQDNTLLLWFGPAVLVLLGVAVLTVVVLRHRSDKAAVPALTDVERRELDALLESRREADDNEESRQ
jgi:cytochrome c-type biogenesis protein CcmH